jgi:hypothetical protein
MPATAAHLRAIRTFEDLIPYLEEELDWPLQQYGFDDLTFEYSPAELGLKDKDAVKVSRIHQLRPLQYGQPWGIFFVEFEKKKLPVVVLRRILSHLVIKKRASANRADAAAWRMGDLLFISAYGDAGLDQREIAFAHFHQEGNELPTLRVLGWDGGDTPLKLEHVATTLHEKLRWPDDISDHEGWRETWRQAFRHRIGHVIRTADALAEALAALARRIRDAALLLLEHETETGALRSLHKAFQTALIHDLSEADFADTYAQTITYGLLTAAISRTEMSDGAYGTALIAENIADIVPVTNPFLKEMLQTFLQVGGRKGGIDFDELGIQDVVELLRGEETDLPAVLRDFGNKTQGEDPVIHFYEHFLAAYDKKLKVQRGVFYTPKPVVGYIVRSVHELLQTEFGLADGLADTTTWGEMAQRNPDLTIPEGTDPDSPFVVMLDPAIGTATFMVEVVEVIYQTMAAKWQKMGLTPAQRQAAWNEYVPQHLLPRLYGYELMMAPYAIAHMKMGLKLYETGYRFGSQERVRVYLTNALEKPEDQPKLAGILPALAHEAEAVSVIKHNCRFTVIIGNPPYSNFGRLNRIPFILNLLDEYKRGLEERKINLDDDFIKFIRLAQWSIDLTGYGIIAYITNNTYLDGLTHRQMRQSLLNSHSKATIINLNGGIYDSPPEGCPDVNVFDIQQGVCITILVRQYLADKAGVTYRDVWGTRPEKYNWLLHSSHNDNLMHIDPVSPDYFLIPRANSNEEEYKALSSINDIFMFSNSALQTKKDALTIHFDEASLNLVLKAIRNLEPEDLRERFQLGPDGRDWTVSLAKQDVTFNKGTVFSIQYRPFDFRLSYYTGKTKGFIAYPRRDLTDHLLKPNLALATTRQIRGTIDPCEALVSRHAMTDRAMFSTHGTPYLFPLYLYTSTPEKYATTLFLQSDSRRRHNLSNRFAMDLQEKLGCRLEALDKGDLEQSVGPEDVFEYIYGILYSNDYRIRYGEFIKNDYPRIPITSDSNLFKALVAKGRSLVILHLIEFALEDEAGAPAEWPRYPRLAQFSGSNRVIEKFPAANKAWQAGRVAINSSSGFTGVPEAVWNFHIGGYQVCHKWLKDRKGRTLSDADIHHYCKIVTALHQTIRLMAEIDEVIEEHGGWPIE